MGYLEIKLRTNMKGVVLRIEHLDYNCEIGSWKIRYFGLGTTDRI